MKIDIKQIKTTPPNLEFNFCVFGEPNEQITKWVEHWGFKTEKSGPFTNIILFEDVKLSDIFNINDPYKYVDGFSPNLNKFLHIGHLSNLVLAKSFQKLGIGEEFIAILGDTLSTPEQTEDHLTHYKGYCDTFGYDVSKIFMASQVKCDESILVDGEGDYEGTKVFDLGDEKIVGKKGNGKTTYFYQDVALAEELEESTLYMTGNEQDNHFNSVKKIHPHVNHVGLGLVQTKEGKMSSSLGNVVLLGDVIKLLSEMFDGDLKLVYNVLAGQILKSVPKTNKMIDLDTIKNPKTSMGLYISYTMASLKSAGVPVIKTDEFHSQALQYDYIKSVNTMSPSYLFGGLVNICKKVNGLYQTHYIQDNEDNKKMFSVLLSDIELASKKLGLFSVQKV